MFASLVAVEDPSLVGKKLFYLLPGMRVQDDFPFKCAPGLLGSNETRYQVSAKCAGLCPAGYTCPREATMAPLPCPRGSYCPEGSTTPLPCPGGTASNVTHGTSRATCSPVAAGFWAPLGSAVPEPCPASGFYCPGAALDDVNPVGGSKPIIVPVGDSTTTKQVETVQKQLSLDVSCATFNYDSVKLTLANQYNVDVALIAFPNPCAVRRLRARSLAAVTLTITIASEGIAADGSPVSTPVANLLAAVQSVNDAALAGSLGTALGTTVTVTSTPPTQASMQKTVKFTCPKVRREPFIKHAVCCP